MKVFFFIGREKGYLYLYSIFINKKINPLILNKYGILFTSIKIGYDGYMT